MFRGDDGEGVRIGMNFARETLNSVNVFLNLDVEGGFDRQEQIAYELVQVMITSENGRSE